MVQLPGSPVLEPHLRDRQRLSTRAAGEVPPLPARPPSRTALLTWIRDSGMSVRPESCSRRAMPGYGSFSKARTSSSSCALLKVVLLRRPPSRPELGPAGRVQGSPAGRERGAAVSGAGQRPPAPTPPAPTPTPPPPPLTQPPTQPPLPPRPPPPARPARLTGGSGAGGQAGGGEAGGGQTGELHAGRGLRAVEWHWPLRALRALHLGP